MSTYLRFLSPDTIQKITSGNLHKIAANLVKAEGYDVGSEMTLPGAVSVLGAKLRQKNAEYQRIAEAINTIK